MKLSRNLSLYWRLLVSYLLVIGVVAWFIARALVPGKDSMSVAATIVLGIVGSFVGGFLGYLITHHDADDGAFQASGIIGSIIGAVIALQVGGLIKQFGAQSFTGSASVLAVIQQAAPIGTALLIAGAGGSAIAADLGARKIREELDAMMVLGIDPIQRLVVPRVLACMLVSVFLNGLVSVVGVAGGYVFNVILQDGTPGAYIASFTALAQLPDLYIGLIKSVIFGLIAAVVAAYKGMNAGGGPKGVGDAVNESVVITFLLLFVVNFVLSTIYLQLVPPKGG